MDAIACFQKYQLSTPSDPIPAANKKSAMYFEGFNVESITKPDADIKLM